MKKIEIELKKGCEYVGYFDWLSFALALRFNGNDFCVTFSEQSEEDLKNFGYLFTVYNIKNDWNYCATNSGFEDIEKYYKPTPILSLDDRFAKKLLKELKKELLKECK